MRMSSLCKTVVVCVSFIGCLLGFLSQAGSQTVEQAGAVVVALPTDAHSPHNSRVMLPVTIQGVGEQPIFSYQFTVRFDPAVLSALGVSVENTVSTGWSIAANHQTPGEMTVGAFHPTPLTGNGRLLTLLFAVVGEPARQTAVTWHTLLLNEGQPPVQVVDGSFQVDTAATATATPTPTLPLATPTIAPPRATTSPPQRAGYLPIIRR